MAKIVEVQNVSKSFGRETVLKNITLSLEDGKIYGIVGRNGSGKTVLMKCILGFMRPSSGSVHVFGKQIGKDCDYVPDTGMIIETPGFIDTESGISNLKYLAGLSSAKGISSARVMKMVGLDPYNKKPVSKYSLGMRQRLGIAQAIMDKPRFLVLDEPMNGLDNKGVEDMRRLFMDLREKGATILLASHNPLDISVLCDEVYEMDQGILQHRKQHP